MRPVSFQKFVFDFEMIMTYRGKRSSAAATHINAVMCLRAWLILGWINLHFKEVGTTLRGEPHHDQKLIRKAVYAHNPSYSELCFRGKIRELAVTNLLDSAEGLWVLLEK
jgi:hypothetical protein